MLSNELLNQLQELAQSANLTFTVKTAIYNLMVTARKEGYSDGFDDGRYEEGYNSFVRYPRD